MAAFVQNRVGKELEDDPEYQRRVREGLIQPVDEVQTQPQTTLNPRAKWSVLAFLLGVASFEEDGMMEPLSMPQTIEIVMMSIAALILLVGKADVKAAVNGNIFSAGMNAMIAIFGIAWMGDTFFNGNLEFFKSHIADIVTQYPFLFAIALFIMSIMLFSQAATVGTLFPLRRWHSWPCSLP